VDGVYVIIHAGTVKDEEAIRGICSSLEEKRCTLEPIFQPLPLMKTV
jgi:hypothetical protein